MNTMTDEELDRDWKPNGRRPQSTIARSFSAELMDIFRIENSVADLDEQVDKRKQQINSQTTELEALEARIREMEQRLKTQPLNQAGRPSGSPRAQRLPITNAFDDPDAPPPPPPPAKDDERSAPSQRDQGYGQHKYGGRRPGTARESQQAVPGALPPTPVGSEGECEPANPRTTPRSSTRARLGGQSTSASAISFSSTSTARVQGTPGDDSGSVKSMSESLTFADYVVVSRPDGDREKDS
ncbi:hypothetical protein B0T14DRAFT_276589 [Immersiella caudata]|uniref:Uncharacterized protein n=1 Tax=Immersiella caudata TaxID=314043 RepID=A0AA40BTR2_9PEZI|nr:hypothetical protein B0T14DRAFT_276589 [Immersiella caudata]